MKAPIAIAAVLACVAVTACQAPATKDTQQANARPASEVPLPPKDATNEQLRAWVDRYVDKGGYVEASIDDKRLILWEPATVEILGNGHVAAWLRSELFRAVPVEGKTLRSVRKRSEIDCRERRYRELVFEGYAGSNMQQPVAGLKTPDKWGKPLPANSSTGIHKACDHVKIAAIERPANPPPPAGAAEEQVREWITRYIEEGFYKEAAIDENRVHFYDPQTLQKLPDGHVVGWFRAELFRTRDLNGIGVRSMRKKLEVDCKEWRYKELAAEGFAGTNMRQPVHVPMSAEWTRTIAGDTGAGESLRKACGDEKVRG